MACVCHDTPLRPTHHRILLKIINTGEGDFVASAPFLMTCVKHQVITVRVGCVFPLPGFKKRKKNPTSFFMPKVYRERDHNVTVGRVFFGGGRDLESSPCSPHVLLYLILNN